MLLIFGAPLRSNLLFAPECVLEIAAHTLKLGLPCGEWVILALVEGPGIQHVAH